MRRETIVDFEHTGGTYQRAAETGEADHMMKAIVSAALVPRRCDQGLLALALVLAISAAAFAHGDAWWCNRRARP